MAHSTKKPWIKPELKRFESLEKLSNFCRSTASAAERQKLEEFLDQARLDQAGPTRQRGLRRNRRG